MKNHFIASKNEKPFMYFQIFATAFIG